MVKINKLMYEPVIEPIEALEEDYHPSSCCNSSHGRYALATAIRMFCVIQIIAICLGITGLVSYWMGV